MTIKVIRNGLPVVSAIGTPIVASPANGNTKNNAWIGDFGWRAWGYEKEKIKLLAEAASNPRLDCGFDGIRSIGLLTSKAFHLIAEN